MIIKSSKFVLYSSENYDFIGEGVSQKLFENGVCLPSDTKMTEQDLDRIVKIIIDSNNITTSLPNISAEYT